MTGRASGIRFAIDCARIARRELEKGVVGPAIVDWGSGKAHLAFTRGLVENGTKPTAAFAMLDRWFVAFGTRLERAVAPRAAVPGYEVMEPITEAFDGCGLTRTQITNLAAIASAAIVRRWNVTERRS